MGWNEFHEDETRLHCFQRQRVLEIEAPFAGLNFGWNWLENTVPAKLLGEKNTVPAEKTSWKVRIIREAHRATLKGT